jgi:Asp-tRNA(Asn)/Glu-tRNA(Gln) amidotransferase B subunit
MYEHHITDMANLLTDDKELRKQFKSIMKDYWSDKIAVTWHIDDIIGRAEDRDIPLVITEEQAQDILGNLQRKHDCEIGINWDVIDFWIDEQLNHVSDHHGN